jgi:hypothetical protein
MKLVGTLDDTDKQIIKLLCEGVAPKQLPGKVWKSAGAIHKRLFTLRKYYDCKTTYELIAKLSKEVE